MYLFLIRAVGLHFSAQTLADNSAVPSEKDWIYSPQHIVVTLYGCLYVCFVTYHINHAYSHLLWNTVVVANACVIIALLASWVMVLTSYDHCCSSAQDVHIVLMMGGFSILLIFPVFIKILIADFTTLVRIFKAFTHYMLFLPTIIG